MRRHVKRIKGFRTIGSAAVLGFAGLTIAVKDLLAEWGYGVKELLAMAGIHDASVGWIVVGLSLWFGFLRIVTTTPVLTRAEDEGE